MKNTQRGGTFLGFIMGLVLGLGLSLAVAIYVTKVPTPFSNKNQPRSSEQDSAETQKNKDWNPNTVLQPKAPAEVPASPTATSATSSTATPAATPSASDKPADKAAADAPKAEPRPAVTADPLGDLAKAKSGLSTPASTGNTADPFDYVIQVGAYRTTADADAQKAKLALIGLDAKVSERDQGGRTVYRVRLGPYDDKGAAEKVRAKLESNSIENTLVRVQR
ncbi:MAG: sporulation protein [Comamonadaceae bacterium PBBC2]|nr:MAG: sporulation protein [Comamonadaceae bacterium PBBC2]